MSGKKFIRISLILTAAFLVLIAAVNVAIDPLFQYHKPWFGLEPVITNERYQNAGVIKHFDFDNAIMGTSMCENFKVSEVNEVFGGQTVKVTMSGSSAYNMTYQFNIMKNRQELPKNILCCMDSIIFEAPSHTDKNPIPVFLYNNDLFDDAEYLWNFTIFNDFTFQTIMLNINHSVPDYDTVFSWNEEKRNENAIDNYKRPEKSNESVNTKAYLTLEKENLALLTQYIASMPETTFVFFMSPFSMLYWDEQTRLNRVLTLKAAYLEACKTLTSYKNVKVHFWADEEMLAIMSDLDNYVDACHYNGQVSSEILKRIKNKQGLVNSNNYQEQVNTLFQYIENFDYEKLFT